MKRRLPPVLDGVRRLGWSLWEHTRWPISNALLRATLAIEELATARMLGRNIRLQVAVFRGTRVLVRPMEWLADWLVPELSNAGAARAAAKATHAPTPRRAIRGEATHAAAGMTRFVGLSEPEIARYLLEAAGMSGELVERAR